MKKLNLKIVSILTTLSFLLTIITSNFPFRLMIGSQTTFAESSSRIVYGDLDKDGIIDSFDLTLMRTLILDKSEYTAEADLNGDNEINETDLRFLKDYILCNIDVFPIQNKNAVNAIQNNVLQKDYSIITPKEPIETSLTADMLSIVEEFNNPVDIYEYLYNSIQTEFYFGSRKGAIGTFEQLSGNDIDSSSLLIAILRHMGYKADYVTALVSLTPSQAMDITGTNRIEQAIDILKLQINPKYKYISIKNDDKNNIISISLEHTWVTAKLPSKYVNGDDSDELIDVQLDINFKKKQPIHVTNVYEGILNNTERTTLNDIIESGNNYDIKNELFDLSKKFENKSLDDIMSQKEYVNFNLIPEFQNTIASLNKQVGSDYVYQFSDRITLYIDGSEVCSLKSAELYDKRLVIEYSFDDNYDLFQEILPEVPESIFDITSHYSKLGIGVQPYIKLDGKIIGTGSSVPIGTEQSLKMSIFSGGNTIEPKETKLLSGSMYAITTDTQTISNNNLFKSIQDLSKIIESKDFREAYRDEYIGLYLSAIGNMYMSNVDLTNKPLMEQYDVYAERYLGVTITSFNLSIEQDNKTGEITINKEGTLGIDVKSNIYSAVSISDDPSAIKKFFQQAGIESSYLESSVLESVTGIESISTMKLMDIAKQKNIPIVSISKQDANYNSLLDSLDISSYALKSISEKVENGYQVIVPMSNITINSWNGIGYITYDGNDSYEFMLSNGTNGGSTSKTVQDMYMYQEYIILAFYSISLILSVITFVSAAAPIAAVLFSATVLPEGFAFTAFWFLATEYLLLSNEQSFERYLDGDATTNESARKLTITTFSLMWLITRVLLNV